MADSRSRQELSKMSPGHLVRLKSKEALLSGFTLYGRYLSVCGSALEMSFWAAGTMFSFGVS